MSLRLLDVLSGLYQTGGFVLPRAEVRGYVVISCLRHGLTRVSLDTHVDKERRRLFGRRLGIIRIVRGVYSIVHVITVSSLRV